MVFVGNNAANHDAQSVGNSVASIVGNHDHNNDMQFYKTTTDYGASKRGRMRLMR